MKKALVFVGVLALAGVFVGGCAKTRCEDVCTWSNDCEDELLISVDVDECIDDCTNTVDDEGDACGDALKAIASCVNDNSGCATGIANCEAEWTDYIRECS
jgi:hypothetical protein